MSLKKISENCGMASELQRPIRKEEAAVLIGKSLRSLEREMQARQIRYYKSGKNVYFTLTDLETYRARCLMKSREN